MEFNAGTSLSRLVRMELAASPNRDGKVAQFKQPTSPQALTISVPAIPRTIHKRKAAQHSQQALQRQAKIHGIVVSASPGRDFWFMDHKGRGIQSLSNVSVTVLG